jgi:hypothetical protein
MRHAFGVIATVQLDGSNRIVLVKDIRRAAGIPRRQKLKVSVTPGRIVLEVEANTQGKLAKRGKLKLWTGAVPSLPLAEAVEEARHYER